MPIEIRIESSWETDDGDGRTVEVTVTTRRHPSEDPSEDTRYFALEDSEKLKQYLCDLIDEKAAFFVGLGSKRRDV